jgi:hypothetical protein
VAVAVPALRVVVGTAPAVVPALEFVAVVRWLVSYGYSQVAGMTPAAAAGSAERRSSAIAVAGVVANAPAVVEQLIAYSGSGMVAVGGSSEAGLVVVHYLADMLAKEGACRRLFEEVSGKSTAQAVDVGYRIAV